LNYRNANLIQNLSSTAREHIVLDVNGLMDVSPEHVGYLEKITGRHDTLAAHTARLREMLPTDFPTFQLNIHSLKVYEGRCKVFMVNCDKNNLEVIRNKMVEMHKQEKIRFMSWREFAGMPDTIRKVAIRKEIYYAKQYESLIITGFKDNADYITMNMQDPEVLQISFDNEDDVKIVDPMETTYVSDFIAQIKSGNGGTLFKNVYPPHNGMREVLVKNEDCSEANEYIKIMRGELAKHMNDRAIQLVFDDPEAAKTEKTTTTWVPYSRAAELIAECEQNSTLINPSKRPRKSDHTGEKITSKLEGKSSNNYKNTNNTNTVEKGNAQLVVPNAWLKTTPTTSEINLMNDDCTTNTGTITTNSSNDEMEEFKATMREEMKANNLMIKNQLQLEMKEMSKANKEATTGQQMDYTLQDLKNTTNKSIFILKEKINQQTIGMETLTASTNQTCLTIETQFDDITSMFSQLMGNKAANIATRIKNLTSPKKPSTHGMNTRSKKENAGEDMSFDSLNTSNSELEFNEKNCTDDSVDEDFLK
jgi:hypothetical protein